MTRRSKLVALEVAAALVRDGDHIALGGIWSHNAPSALVRELIRCGVRGLTLSAAPAAGFAVDLLIAGGGVARAHLPNVTLEHLGLAPAFRRAVESGSLELVESDEASLVGGYRAAAAGLPYQPVASIAGTDLPRTVGRSLLCVERHAPQVFVEAVDFVSGAGRDACVTELASLDFSGEEPALVSVHPGVDAAVVRERTGFELAGPQAPPVTAEPTDEVLEVLRRRVDPTGVLA